MNKKELTWNRSRLEILHYVLQFSTPHYFGDKKEGYDNIWTDVENCFRGGSFSNYEIEKNSLVVITACNTTKWYMSWCLDIQEGGAFGSKKYLLQSIEDGTLCWWENVSVFQYPKSKTDQFPHWKWDDSKWEFWDKWKRACKSRDAYVTLPMMPEFTDDGGVILRTRTRFGLDDHRPEIKFDNWKKVTRKAMLEFYDSASQKPQ